MRVSRFLIRLGFSEANAAALAGPELPAGTADVVHTLVADGLDGEPADLLEACRSLV